MKETDAGVDDNGVDGDIATSLEFVESVVKARLLPVGTSGRHCIDRVGKRDDARANRDRVTLESDGVSRSVEALVVLEDHLGDGP